MSTLTKVLIILLTLASIFLCGIVVTYVSTANNYRLAYEDLQQSLKALEQKTASQLSQMREQTANMQRFIDALKQETQQLKAEKNQLQINLEITKTNEAALQEMINSWASVVQGFKQTIQDMQTSLRLARDELDKVRTEHIDDRRRLTEVTATLDAKIVQLDALEKERRRVLEEKTTLEKLIKDIASRAEQPVTAVEPTTAIKDKATPAWPTQGQTELQALVTKVDLKNSLAAIDVGLADGVELGMKFYVSRSDEFICSILITDIEPRKAVGVLELVQQPPKIGDNATNREPGT